MAVVAAVRKGLWGSMATKMAIFFKFLNFSTAVPHR